MPKDGKKSKKSKKDRGDRPRAQEREAPAPEAPPPEKASKASRGKNSKGAGARGALGGPEFLAEVGRLRASNLAKTIKKEDERKASKNDLKQALETVLQLANKGLKMVNTGQASYLLENINADAEKLKISMAQDEDYIEEVRFKHNKIHDLLDETRDFAPTKLQSDLVRNRDIRTKLNLLVRGGADKDEVLVNPEELLELVKVRNSIRMWFGGGNMAKAQGNVRIEGGEEKQLFAGSNSDIKVKSGKT